MHFAAVPRVLIEPDNVTFAKNVQHLQRYRGGDEARRGKFVIASSETTYGVCFAEGDKDFHEFPLEEDYDVDPMDSYGLSKVCNERTARAFAMRYRRRHLRAAHRQRDRAARVRAFKRFAADPPLRKRNAWSYIDARDLGEIVRLCLEKDGLGFQVFNATNDTITLNMPTREALAMLCPKSPVRREMDEFEAPLSNRKAREVLGSARRTTGADT